MANETKSAISSLRPRRNREGVPHASDPTESLLQEAPQVTPPAESTVSYGGKIFLTKTPIFFLYLLVDDADFFLQTAIEAGLAETLDAVSLQVSLAAQTLVQAFPQVRLLDLYSLSAVS